MADTQDGSVRLALGEYPLGTTVAHWKFPDVKFRVLKQTMGADGQVETVTLQRTGGKFNRALAHHPGTCVDYIAEPGRALSRKLQRAVQNAAAKAAAVPADAPPEGAAPTKRRTPDKQAPAKPIPPPDKPPAKRRPPATKVPKVKRDRGGSINQKRGDPSRQISEVKLDPRNPFEYAGRMHGYFQAFLDGGGRATYGELMASCLSLSAEFGIVDDEKSIQRDLNNQTWNWQRGKWGLLVTRDDSMCEKTAGGHPVKADRDRVVFTCVEVQGRPWASVVGRGKGA